MERMPEGDLDEQMRQESWEARKKKLMTDPEFHLDLSKLKDESKIDPPETIH